MRLTLSGFVFQEAGSAHALEDRYACDWQARVIAVADGVTRPEYGSAAAEESNRVGKVAAEFCHCALMMLAGPDGGELSSRVRKIGQTANERIGVLNHGFGFASDQDYQLRDPYGCVGTCGALDASGIWHVGYIGDCGMLLLRANGKQMSLTQNQLRGAVRVIESLSSLPPSARQNFIRTQLRNRAEARDAQGEPCGYGVLNGDARAESWWTSGSVSLSPGDAVVAYSDGAELLARLRQFQAIVDAFRTSGRAPEAQASCGLLWRDETSRAALPRDDATLWVAVAAAAR
jgi:hypothetical protein